MAELLIFIVLLLIGVFFGGMNERNHFKRLARDEETYAHIKVVSLKNTPDTTLQPGGIIVTGNVVIAVDYFKKIAALLKMIFGGELRAYQSLLIRARREAIVRMKREAADMGADAIYNVRIQFCAIGAQPQAIGGAELLAYGTAVKHT